VKENTSDGPLPLFIPGKHATTGFYLKGLFQESTSLCATQDSHQGHNLLTGILFGFTKSVSNHHRRLKLGEFARWLFVFNRLGLVRSWWFGAFLYGLIYRFLFVFKHTYPFAHMQDNISSLV
jgi:hypothetical protein